MEPRRSGNTNRPYRHRLSGPAMVLCILLATALPAVIGTNPAKAGTGWTIVTSANPPVANGKLGGISCVTGLCVAVGSFSDSSGFTEPLAESLGGSGWTVQTTAFPADSTGSVLNGVSCSSAGACTAVGNSTVAGHEVPLVERWTGGSWTVQPAPAFPGSAVSRLWNVSCASANSCMAVGLSSNQTATAGQATLAESWNGTAWSIVPTPNPDQSTASLIGVSCPSTSECVAVGATSGQSATLAETWDGSTWTIQTAPLFSQAQLSSVSCSSGNACTAVGFYNGGGPSGGSGGALAERWDGSTWTVQTVPSPPSQIGAFVSAVSCPTDNACTAVGYYLPNSGSAPILPFADTWNGSTWSPSSTPSPSQTLNAELLGVDCLAANSCVAVGYYALQGGGFGSPSSALAEGWNRATWAIQTAVTPTGTFGIPELDAVSCWSATGCAAVGFYVDAGGNTVTLAETWNGARWTIQATPNPSGAVAARLLGVSCQGPASCVAVGGSATNVTQSALAEVWDGRQWSMQPLPAPPGAAATQLNGVSCPAAGECIAVGNYSTTPGDSFGGTYAAIWNGTTWTAQPIPLPPGIHSGSLNGVSCPSPRLCEAVGGDNDPASMQQGALTEVWDGTAWTVQPTPNTPGSFPYLLAVDCSSADFCTAVGEYALNANGLALTWDGSVWTRQPVPNPTGALLVRLQSVACPSAGECVATGFQADNAGVTHTLADSWDGAQWTVQPTPNPPGTTPNALKGVACAPLSCMAVGGGNRVTLAEVTSVEPTVARAPTRVSATPGVGGSATVAFSPPVSDGGSPIGSYTVTAADETNPAHGGQTASGPASPIGPIGPITVTGLTNGDRYRFTVTATNSIGTGPASSPSNPVVPGADLYTPVGQSRLLDTRTGGAGAGVAGGGFVPVPVAGRAGVPASGVGAVVLTVTVTQPAAAGYLTVFADGRARPPTSNLTFAAGQTISDLVVVPVGSNGAVDVLNGSRATVQVIADVSGWFGSSVAQPGGLTPVPATRVLDTRFGIGGKSRVGPGGTLIIPLTGHSGIPSSGVGAILLTVTVTQPAAAGYVTVSAHGSPKPPTSNLTFPAGATVSNLVVAPVNSDGNVEFFNGSGGTVQVVADVSGWFAAGPAAPGGYTTLPPARILDTRTGAAGSQKVAAGATLVVPVAGQGGVPASGATSVVLNVAVTQPLAPGYLRLWAGGMAPPATANMTFAGGQTVSNLAIVPVGPDGSIDIYNGSGGTTQLVVDVSGWFAGG